MNEEKINFRVARDFGETFNISVKFLRKNFKLYFISILLLAGPFVLINSFSGAYYQSSLIDKASLVRAGRLYNVSAYSWEYFLSLLTQFIALLAIMCANYSFMIVYNEKGPGNFTVKDIAKKINDHMLKIISGFLVFLLLLVIFAVAIGVVIGLFGEASPILGIFLVFLLFIALLLTGPNIMWQLSASFLVILYENDIAFMAYGRAREVMKNNYWWTWLIVVCSSIMIFILSVVFSLPTIVITIIKMLAHTAVIEETSFIYELIFIFCTFCSTIIYSILYIICGFHFFSLLEKKDRKGLMESINEIGKTTNQNTL
ncbi:MAG: hypothetical protein ACXVED_06825 [Bacteroidia bacterium]